MGLPAAASTLETSAGPTSAPKVLPSFGMPKSASRRLHACSLPILKASAAGGRGGSAACRLNFTVGSPVRHGPVGRPVRPSGTTDWRMWPHCPPARRRFLPRSLPTPGPTSARRAERRRKVVGNKHPSEEVGQAPRPGHDPPVSDLDPGPGENTVPTSAKMPTTSCPAAFIRLWAAMTPALPSGVACRVVLQGLPTWARWPAGPA